MFLIVVNKDQLSFLRRHSQTLRFEIISTSVLSNLIILSHSRWISIMTIVMKKILPMKLKEGRAQIIMKLFLKHQTLQ